MALTLDATNKSIKLQTSSAASLDWSVSYIDSTSTSFTPGDSQGNVSSATTTAIVAAPASSTQRGVKHIAAVHRGTGSQVVTFKKDVGGTEYVIFAASLNAGEFVTYSDGDGWNSFDAYGRCKTSSSSIVATGTRAVSYYKVGTASDAAAYWYSMWKDTGFPGAWSPGSPGINGRVTDGTQTADVGCLPLWTPSGALYLTGIDLTTTVNHFFQLVDVLWVNTGIAVTTTTAQAITTPTLPARDVNGGTNGEGCLIGLVTTTANTNAGVINNSTVTYTNSAGTGSRSATLINVAGDMIPATPVIGNLTWFQLAAGDTGVRSIESVTLATSLGAGAVSLIIGRPIAASSPTIVNNGRPVTFSDPGIRLWTGTCAHLFYKSSTTTATTVNASFYVTER